MSATNFSDTLSNFDWGGVGALVGVALGGFITQWPNSRRFRAERRREREVANDKDRKIASTLSANLRKALNEYLFEIESRGAVFEALFEALEEEETDDRLIDLPEHKSVAETLMDYDTDFRRRVESLFAIALLNLKNLRVRWETEILREKWDRSYPEIPSHIPSSYPNITKTELAEYYLAGIPSAVYNYFKPLLASYDSAIQEELIELPQLSFWGKVRPGSPWRRLRKVRKMYKPLRKLRGPVLMRVEDLPEEGQEGRSDQSST